MIIKKIPYKKNNYNKENNHEKKFILNINTPQLL